MPKVLGVIPARYASQRFPGKPLALIGSKPMIQWVYEACRLARVLDDVVIATEDERIFQAATAFGAKAIMTSPDHKSGTDRLVEVARHYPDVDVFVNIQGDEPGIQPDLISGVAQAKLNHSDWAVATAARPFLASEDPGNPNRVKVVVSRSGRALYFSRSLIPFPRNEVSSRYLLHLGIYAYDKAFLKQYTALPGSLLEEAESLEQLRVLENDFQIGVFMAADGEAMPGVDTPEDLDTIVRIFREAGRI